MDEGLLDKARHQAEGKEYNMPTEEEILALSNPKDYMQQSEAHMVLYDEIKDILRKNTNKTMSASEIHKMMCVTLGTMISAEESQQVVFDMLSNFGLDLEGMDDAQKFLELFMNAWNNTRMWANRGFTPNELVAKMPKEYKPTE